MNSHPNEELVSIIIPNYNEKYTLFNCINSINKQNYKNIEIIVVDNASTDGSSDFIKEKFPKIKLIQNDSNYGFGKALNKGKSFSKGAYILFLNNDTELFKNTILKLKTFLKKHPKTGITYPSEVNKDKSKTTVDKTGIVFELNGFQFRSNSENNDYFEPNGSCFMLKKNDKKLFDEDYFLFGEEYYLGFSQNSKKKKVHLIKDAYFNHLKKKSVSKLNSFEIAKNVEKNSLTNFFISWSKKTLILLAPLIIFDLIYSYVYLLLSLKWSYLLGKLAGTADFIFSIKKLYSKRNHIQQEKTINDSEILKIFTKSRTSNKFLKLTFREKIFMGYKKYLSFFVK
jgi:GT2 family glycosyltransferase